MCTATIPPEGLPGLDVRSAAVTSPHTWGPGTTVGRARAAFADDHVHMLLITDGARLLGTLVRADLDGPVPAPAGDRALRHAVLAGRTVGPTAPAEDVRRSMLERGQRRLAVVDDDGLLLGLLCLKRHGGGFCGDDDVLARQAERSASGVA